MEKTRATFRHKDQTMSQCVDPQTDLVGHNNNKAITNPLSLSLLIGLKNNKCISDSDFVRSPKSPLEFRMLSTMADPFFLRCPRSSLTAHLNCCCGPAKVGLLSIVDSLGDDDRVLTPDVVFGPSLRIKSSEIRDKHPKLFPDTKSVKIEKERSGVVFEIELEEDEDNKEKSIEAEFDSMFLLDNFLSVCNFCNKKLVVGEDIYMYRGDKAFCSAECRAEEMAIDEEDLEDSCIVMQESSKKLF